MTQENAATEIKLRGHALIAGEVKRLPNAPGVYRMLNAKGDVLYVGKARDLKKRVTSYARKTGHVQRIKRMIAETTELVVVVTASEIEALLLEANYIKRFKPRYNVLFRDDKSFPDILLRKDHPYPQILKHRGARKDNGRYFGPFASADAVNRTLNTLQRAFLLRSCSDSVFESRTRPCLLHQIKRCSAPCVKRISDTDYADLVKQAEQFLSGRSNAVQEALAEAMDEASGQFKYEQAASLRDRIGALTHVQANQGVNPSTFADADVFAIHEEGGHSCVQVFFFRASQNWGNRCYFPRHDKSFGAREILAAFLAQFYDNREAPKLILLSQDIPDRDLLEKALSVRMNCAVEISVPKRGEKLKFIEQAKLNARGQLSRRMAENASQQRLLEGVAETFGLDAPPRRIEVYDNSHIQGANALGAMVVAGAEGFEKKEYRKYNIRSADLAPGDDYAMLREVLTRRFKRLADAEPGSEDDRKRPDIVLIDGGPGQLAVAKQVMADSGAGDLTLVAIAKGHDRDAGREHFHVPGREPFRLEPRDPVLFYLQRLRDEAHRFAIGGHRKKRSVQIGVSPLDEIEGVGGGRKRALLHHFGSARAVADAQLADLEAVPGISKALAKKIHDHFHAR